MCVVTVSDHGYSAGDVIYMPCVVCGDAKRLPRALTRRFEHWALYPGPSRMTTISPLGWVQFRFPRRPVWLKRLAKAVRYAPLFAKRCRLCANVPDSARTFTISKVTANSVTVGS